MNVVRLDKDIEKPPVIVTHYKGGRSAGVGGARGSRGNYGYQSDTSY